MIRYPVGLLLGGVVMSVGLYAFAQTPVERPRAAPKLQVWTVREQILGVSERLRVIKFQVGQAMVCKAYIRELHYTFQGEDQYDLAFVSLGEVPCE